MTNYQINLEESTPVEELDFNPLDKRYKNAHIAGVALIYLLLMLLALLLLATDITWICVAAESALAIACIINMTILPKAYAFKGYAIREHDITYRTGIIFPKLTTIPYSRIQQVSLKQNPISKLFNLSSVEIVNGAQGMSELTIPGLDSQTANILKVIITEKLRNEHE